ncbi:MAG: TadE family type IV pilus minor pilin [Acidimicrobiia bacterium]
MIRRCSWFPRRRGGGSDDGQATVEFAFLLPLVVLAALAVIQVGLVVRDQMGVVHAAREAARAASVDTDPARAVRAAHRTLPGAVVEVGGRPKIGEEITVTIRYRSVTNLPLVGALFPDPELHASATMRVEK